MPSATRCSFVYTSAIKVTQHPRLTIAHCTHTYTDTHIHLRPFRGEHAENILDITEELFFSSVPFCPKDNIITMRISPQMFCLVVRCNSRLFPVNALLNVLPEMTCNYVKGRLSVKVYLKVLLRRYTRMLLGRNC